MGINEVTARSILQRSQLPDADYVINPYTGCTHGCVYCYARFMKRFTGHTESWGTFLDAKVNAPELLKRRLTKKRTPLNGTVFLSSVTDPYQPAEARYRLTQQLLEILLEHQVTIDLLTKSELILRDVDLLRQFEHCTVGVSLMTVDDTLGRRFEPRASTPSQRLEALRALHDSGLHTRAFVSPYLPGLSDIDVLIDALDGAVDEIGVEAFNPRGSNWTGVAEILARYYPHLLPGYRERVKADEPWQALEAKSRRLAAQHDINFVGFYRHN